MGGELPNRVIYLVLMLMRWDLTPHYHYFCTKLHSYVHTLYMQALKAQASLIMGADCLLMRLISTKISCTGQNASQMFEIAEEENVFERNDRFS